MMLFLIVSKVVLLLCLMEKQIFYPNQIMLITTCLGSVPLELYLKTKQQKYLDLGLKYADTQWTLPEDAKSEQKDFASQGYSWQTRIWIDDMFMITAVQAQAYRATGDLKYIDRAAKEMVLYLDKIQLANGLFYHSPDAPFSWGRGKWLDGCWHG